MGHCNLCGRYISADGVCEVCRATLFQITEILEMYLGKENPPEWLTLAIGEFAWILEEYPPTAAFFNVAQEVLFKFVLDGQTELTPEDLRALALTNWPRDRVLFVLDKAKVIELKESHVYPGKLSDGIIHTRWAGYALADEDYQNKMIEFRGVLTLSLVYSLLQEEWLTVRRAMAIIGILSILIMNDFDARVLDDDTFNYALSALDSRQRNRITLTITGFRDGVPKMITDATETGLLLKPELVDYVVRMRERYRERSRDERLRSA